MRRLYTLFAILLILAACSRPDEEQDPTPSDPNSIVLLTASAKPGQMVVAQLSSPVSISDNASIAIGSVEVMVIPTEDNQVVFVMPTIPAGKSTVDFKGIGIAKKLEVNVEAYSPITDPDIVLNRFVEEIDQVAIRFDAHVADPVVALDGSYITLLHQQQLALKENFSKLSNDEKLKVAYILQGNMPADEDFTLALAGPTETLRLAAWADPTEKLVERGRSLGRNLFYGIPLTYAGFKLALLPSLTLVDKVAATAFLTTGLVHLMAAVSDAKRVGRLEGIPDDISSVERLAAPVANDMIFYKDLGRLLTVKVVYRNLSHADKSSSVTDIAGIFTSISRLQNLYNKTVSLANKVKSWFYSTGPDVPAYANTIGAQVLKKEYTLPGSKLSIKNISESAITFKTTAQDNGLQIVASSATLTQDKTFTFDVAFSDAVFKEPIAKKVNAIYKPARVGVTVAGNNGKGEAANQLWDPTGVALDKQGNVYVADAGNYRVQKWAPGATSGVTVAGGHSLGSEANQFNYISGIFVDAAGNLYVSDSGNSRVQRWSPGATSGVTVAGGNGNGSAANQLSSPSGVFVDNAGNVYVADMYNNRVQKWAPGAKSGVTVAGGNGKGSGASQLDFPYDVHVDQLGNIYVSEDSNNRVQKWAPGAASGVTVAGGNGDGDAASQLSHPTGIWLDASGNLYVSDTNNNRIQKWAAGATSGVKVVGGLPRGSNDDQISFVMFIAMDANNNLYVSDNSNHRVQKWAP